MRRRRLAAVVGLLVLAPIGAEYLVGYDTSTGNWAALAFGLLFFAPLYGGAALIVREVAVRAGRGWSTRLCWAAAFGVAQAGLVDQSLFRRSDPAVPYWEAQVGQTWIPVLGFSLGAALSWVLGHVVFSIAAPTVVVESIHPSVRHRPWLGRFGLGLTVLLYAAVSAVLLSAHMDEAGGPAGMPQLLGAGVVVLGLALLGLRLGRRSRPQRTTATTPSPWWVGSLALVAAVAVEFDQSPVGTAVAVVVLVAALVLLDRSSRAPGWSARHVLMLAGGVLLARALLGFLVDPIGDGPAAAKYAHNTVAVLLVVALVALGWIRLGADLDVRGTVSVDSSRMNAVSEESIDGTGEHDGGGASADGNPVGGVRSVPAHPT